MRKGGKKIVRLFDDAVAAEKKYEFQNAKHYNRKIEDLHPKSPEGNIARGRMADMDAHLEACLDDMPTDMPKIPGKTLLEPAQRRRGRPR